MRTLNRPSLVLIVLLSGCGDDPPVVPDESPTVPPGPAAPPPVAPPAPAPPEGTLGNEACAQIIVVSWQGAERAPEGVTRSEADARARATELWGRLERGEDFATLARAESDAPSSRPRGGLMGTYPRDEWPPVHAAIRDAVFRLQVGQWSEVVPAPYGFVVARRCPVEKVHTRHILVRYRGAKNAGDDVTRTQVQAAALAREIHAEVARAGADFAAIARERSEDGSADRGGDVGNVGRGRLAAAYEEVAFNLAPGAISAPVETEFGFHVIQRVE